MFPIGSVVYIEGIDRMRVAAYHAEDDSYDLIEWETGMLEYAYGEELVDHELEAI